MTQFHNQFKIPCKGFKVVHFQTSNWLSNNATEAYGYCILYSHNHTNLMGKRQDF